VTLALVEPLAAPRLVVEDLRVNVAGSQASVVDRVSLHVGAGEVLGIVGESGSGKTTLALAMIGYVRRGLTIAGGSIRFGETELLSLSPGQLRRLRGAELSYVPQDPSTALNPTMKVGSQLREVLTAHGRSRKEVDSRVLEVLAEVGLAGRQDLLEGFPHQLSGGQQQRIAIAIAFACRPSLIVLDEPTTGLDVTTQRTVLDTVAALCSSYGVAAVYVSHDVAVVSEISQRVGVVYAGRLVEIGPTASVFTSPEHPYTRGLLRAVPSSRRSQRLIGIEGVPPRPGNWPPGCTFEPRCPVRIDQCRVEQPELVVVSGPSHRARCLRVGDPAAGRAAFQVEALSPHASAPAGATALLAVDRLSAAYGATRVLDDVAFALRPDSCLAVVGESGSGKTTLARCIIGLHTNWDGALAYDGKPLVAGVRNRAADSLREIQYVFQNPYASLNPRRTVGALVAQPLEHFTQTTPAQTEARVFDAIRSVSLPTEVVNRYPDQLSGGERQRVAIARALVVSPRLLICDEITSALDVSVQASIVELLRRLQRELGLAMLFITHNLALVRNVAQEIVVMQNGRIVESGAVEDVLEHPQTPYTQRLISHVPSFDTQPIEPS
jgi:peptide/nickel transport system ATP-binding protein